MVGSAGSTTARPAVAPPHRIGLLGFRPRMLAVLPALAGIVFRALVLLVLVLLLVLFRVLLVVLLNRSLIRRPPPLVRRLPGPFPSPSPCRSSTPRRSRLSPVWGNHMTSHCRFRGQCFLCGGNHHQRVCSRGSHFPPSQGVSPSPRAVPPLLFLPLGLPPIVSPIGLPIFTGVVRVVFRF